LVILVGILSLFYCFNKKIKTYIKINYPELVVHTLIVIWSVFVGAYLALEFTKKLNDEEDKQSYLSMIVACKNMNERYIKNFNSISSNLDSGFVSSSELNRLINNIKEPLLIEEILINSNLYKCSSVDFRNWLPDIVSFMRGNKWIIVENNNEIFEYNYHFLHFLKEILSNEETYIKNSLSEREIASLNDKARLRFKASIKDTPFSDILIELQSKELTDSLSAN
jgi:hypothetical protein